ncbi:nuclear factor of activated T-cells, cytoplasmic 1-like isoform X1 [Brienomyrus brachyistius]|uniref:nuclear factor of activated T-cells, cytoplasmic 1-like isoform X1 n=1 Tax=Brienomyrus brachyistius TaxID=42636 RepID=UPI0020B28DC9|nr:nuclear factor of activated T-cells, cytoplasmic 1-like isoform X1 [Brienomyrus brachyistius]
MQDNRCLRVSSKFNFGPLAPSAVGKETGLRFLSSLTTNMKSAEEDAFSYSPNASMSLPLSVGNPCLSSQFHGLAPSPVISVSSCHQAAYGLLEDTGVSSYYMSPGLRPNGGPTLESPRIEITAYGQLAEEDVKESRVPVTRQLSSAVMLTLPSTDGYRDPSGLSPASSLSSRSCHSEASSYESGFSYNYDNSPATSPWQSPCVSPKGPSSLASCALGGGSPRQSPAASPRPTSPCGGKRKYSFSGSGGGAPCRRASRSATPSPQGSPRLGAGDDTWPPDTNRYTNSAIVAAINALSTDGTGDNSEDIPLKARRTNQESGPGMSLKVESGGEELILGETQEDYPSPRLPFKKENYSGGFLDVPQYSYSWSKPKPYISPSLPALDWQLPSCSGPYNLQIEMQPKSHHRAHYETEGSRGAVKAPSGGHPVVQLYGYMESEPLTLQLFIGTADDRLLRPHAFYQVHRITGKTVSTSSHEVMQSNTKVLEIPLLPENNMRAIIDCAGILKLRNSDIELRKGETDIGRKNTRVRMVFRVHIEQANGRTVSLQAASNPIECSQRSAQELPLVEKQNVDSCVATGGKKMLLSGHNFLPDSKVLFLEKAQDGHHIWETEAKVEKESLKATTLVVEIPPYHNQRISSPIQVNFYVCNGKRKRSQYQRFTYLPPNVPMIKTEPNDDYEPQGVPALGLPPKPYYGPQGLSPMMHADPSPCLAGGYPACQQRHGGAVPPSSPSSSPTLHDLTPTAYPRCLPAGRSPDHAVPALLPVAQAGSPHGYNLPPLFSAGSPVSSSPSPASHPSTPGLAPEGPFAPPATTLARKTPPALLTDSATPPALPVTIKQEPQELDQMYLDDVNEIIRNDLSSISVHSHA